VSYPKAGLMVSLAGEVIGMEKPKRARRRKLDTAKVNLKPSFADSGGRGVHREVESERHEEKSRAVINGGHPNDEPVGQRWDRSSLHHGGEGVLIHPPYQGDCGWHGTEEQRVTSGGLTGSLGGTAVSGPISESEMASNALSVDGRLRSTRSVAKDTRPGNRRRKWVGEGSR
jgi:hypothetical protein